MTMHNQIFENVWPPSLDSKNRLQNFQDMVESTIQHCFEITHFRRKIQQILEFQKVENQTVQLELNGNELYLKVLQRLLNLAFESISGDVNVYLDRSTFIPLQTFRKITGEISLQKGCNLKKCDKVTSHQNRCVQIADYVAGAINYNFRNNDSTFMDLIKERIRCP